MCWVCQVMVVGLRFPVETSAESEPVYSEYTRMSHGLGGNSEPGAESDGLNVSTTTFRAYVFHCDSHKSQAQHEVGATASASRTAQATLPQHS